ncbi:MAG: hypothetical protein WC779_05155 [Candidatus Omnitrophota bacterium]|jgi:hypothetical protein
MERLQTKSLEKISSRMQDIDESSIRYRILNSAKNFKTSWIELGQSLYSVWKDKLYKDWGYLTFDAYTAKEIGIKKQTALKLLKSYYFLEKEEPIYLKKDYNDSEEVAAVPSYESVNVLRLAKSKKDIDADDYAKLKTDVLDNGKDAREVKKDLCCMMKQREELDPEDARRKKRVATVRRYLSTLKSLKRDIEFSKMVSSGIIKEISGLINKIEAEIA